MWKIVSDAVITMGVITVFYYIGSMIHFHRWNNWKIYFTDRVTRQYRTCKGCGKIEDEMVSYSILPLEIIKDKKDVI
jgi:hypothetical protein